MPARARLLGRPPRHVDAVEQDDPGSLPRESGDHVEQRGLPRPVRADQPDDFRRCDLEGDVVDGDHAPEADREAANVERLSSARQDRRRRGRSRRRGCRRRGGGGRADQTLREASTARRPERGQPVGRSPEQLDDAEAAQDDQPRGDVVEVGKEIVRDLRDQRPWRGSGTRRRPGDPPEPADDRVLHQEDRTEDVEGRELHVRLLEGEEHATESGDPGADRERVELDAHDADAEPGRGSLVAANGDHLAAGRSGAEVGHHQTDEDERDQHERRVPLGMEHRIELVAQDLGTPHDEPFESSRHAGVLEDQRAEDERERQRHDGERHPAGADRRQGDEHAHRGRRDHTDQHGDQEGHVEAVGRPSRRPCTEARQRVLAERQLAGVARHHDDRRDDDADAERRDERARSSSEPRRPVRRPPRWRAPVARGRCGRCRVAAAGRSSPHGPGGRDPRPRRRRG